MLEAVNHQANSHDQHSDRTCDKEQRTGKSHCFGWGTHFIIIQCGFQFKSFSHADGEYIKYACADDENPQTEKQQNATVNK